MTVSAVRAAKTQAISATSAASTSKVPSKKVLENVLGTYSFHAGTKGVWKTSTPPKELKAANILKDVVLSEPKKGAFGGAVVTAHVLKGTPTKVIFENRVVGGHPGPDGRQVSNVRYFGPVRTDILPK